jgi:hypothetical protein
MLTVTDEKLPEQWLVYVAILCAFRHLKYDKTA